MAHRGTRSKRFFALVGAMEARDVDTVRDLIRRWPDLASKMSYSGYTILGLAAADGATKVVDCLLHEGVDPNGRGSRSVSALHGAAYGREGALSSILLLFKAGAEVDAVDDSGTTPLMVACHHTDLGCAALLLARGANPALRNEDGMSAYDLLLASYNSALGDKRMYRHQIAEAKILFEMLEALS